MKIPNKITVYAYIGEDNISKNIGECATKINEIIDWIEQHENFGRHIVQDSPKDCTVIPVVSNNNDNTKPPLDVKKLLDEYADIKEDLGYWATEEGVKRESKRMSEIIKLLESRIK